MKVVDGTLYLNLDKKIQSKWERDIPGYIKTADANWAETKDQAPSDLPREQPGGSPRLQRRTPFP